jgi:DMSO/TMAO reductase YedYZ molybdopterin-dependent catalytic subunit
MTNRTTRRQLLKGSLAAAGLGVFGIPDWALPALAQGETLVPFTDYPEGFTTIRSATNRVIDLRKIQGPLTPKDEFYTTQHYGHPDVDPAAFRLKVSGLVKTPKSLSLDDLKKMKSVEMVCGFECSGNSPRSMQGLASNGRWTGVPLRAVLDQAGVKTDAREFVFFGADKGEEEVEFRTNKYTVVQQFGRSLTREKALSSELLLAYAMNGEPLTKHQGFPLRLVVPGWYGVANVKWLSEIHVQTEDYLGKYQARWYRTLRGETVNGEVKWKEAAITRMNVKSVVARVTTSASGHAIMGYVLSDGSPVKSVEVKIDDGPWQPATLNPTMKDKFSWKFFTFSWTGATPGAHTIVSRATDANGVVQPTVEELVNKKTFLEDNAQFPRKVTI